jgi:tetratricopeptide (TPR) repeat protein
MGNWKGLCQGWSIIILLSFGLSWGCGNQRKIQGEGFWEGLGNSYKGSSLHTSASFLVENDEREQAIQILMVLIDTNTALPNEYRLTILLFLDNEELSSAIHIAQKWMETYPNDAAALFNLGCLQIMNGQPTEGLGLLQIAGKLDTSLNGKIDKISQKVKKLLLEENHAYQKLELGRVFALVGEWQFARICFLQTIHIDPKYGEGWAFLGEAEQHVGRDGKEALDQAIRLSPSSAIVQVHYSFYWQRKGDFDRALDYLKNAALIEPGQPMWQAEIGRILALSGDINLALEYYQRAVELGSSESIYWQMLARFCADYEIELKTVGLPAAREALILTPEDTGALSVMGEVLFKLNDLQGAERFLQQAIKDSGQILAHLRLGQIYIQQMRMDEAYKNLHEVVDDPDAARSEYEPAHRLLEQYYGE